MLTCWYFNSSRAGSSETLHIRFLASVPTVMVCYCTDWRQVTITLFFLLVQDEVFEFPGVTAGHRDLDSRAITLVTGSSRKISVRLQRATTSQATQTEPVWSEAGWGDSGSHTFPKMKSKFHDKAAKDKGFAKWENEKPVAQAGVDVVDRGTAFEPDQDEGQDETKQDGEVSAVKPQLASEMRRLRVLIWAWWLWTIASWLPKQYDWKSRCNPLRATS